MEENKYNSKFVLYNVQNRSTGKKEDILFNIINEGENNNFIDVDNIKYDNLMVLCSKYLFTKSQLISIINSCIEFAFNLVSEFGGLHLYDFSHIYHNIINRKIGHMVFTAKISFGWLNDENNTEYIEISYNDEIIRYFNVGLDEDVKNTILSGINSAFMMVKCDDVEFITQISNIIHIFDLVKSITINNYISNSNKKEEKSVSMYDEKDKINDSIGKFCVYAYNIKSCKDEQLIYSIVSTKTGCVTYHSIYIHDKKLEYNSLSSFLNDYIISKENLNRLFDRIKESAFELLAEYIGRYPTSGKSKKYTVKRTDKDIIDDNVSVEFNWDNINNRVIINYTSGYKTYYNPDIKDFADLFDISSDKEFENALVDLLNLFERMKEIDMRYYFRNKYNGCNVYHHNKFPTIAIIGSTKFAKQFKTSAQYFQILGYVVLTTFIYDGADGRPISEAMQIMFEELGCQRIAMADEVFVVNVNGYIGENTKKELEFAKSIGKPISYYTEKF